MTARQRFLLGTPCLGSRGLSDSSAIVKYMFDSDMLVSASDDSSPALGGTVPLERLEAQICELAGHLAAATCRFLVLLGDFDARRGWASWDMHSCAQWLSWKCQMTAGTAREHVRVARALRDLPVIRGEFERADCLCKGTGADPDRHAADRGGPGRDRRTDDRQPAGAVRPSAPAGQLGR